MRKEKQRVAGALSFLRAVWNSMLYTGDFDTQDFFAEVIAVMFQYLERAGQRSLVA